MSVSIEGVSFDENDHAIIEFVNAGPSVSYLELTKLDMRESGVMVEGIYPPSPNTIYTRFVPWHNVLTIRQERAV